MELTLKLKPSLVGQYYEKQCDKYLVYNSLEKKEYSNLGWEQPISFRQTAAAKAGAEWETILLKRLLDDSSCEVLDLKHDDDHEVTLGGTVEALKSLKTKDKPIYIYQACLGITPSFSEKYFSSLKNLSSQATFSHRMFPDFIKAEYRHSEEKYCLTVIDAKNASFLKMGAEIQIALYVKILKEIIKDFHIDNCYVNEEEGIVWNREKITDNRLEHVFGLMEATHEVDVFFDDKLVNICTILDSCSSGTEIQNELDYRINHKCEFCDNFETCKNYCKKERNVRLMPYITIEAQNRLKELKDSGDLKDDTLESVKAIILSNPDLLTQDCSFWKNVKNNIEAYEKGLISLFDGKKDRFAKVGSSMSFPIGQHFALILTAQQDVSTGRNYAYSWLMKPGKGIDIWEQGLNDNGFVVLKDGKDGSSGKGTYFDSIVAQEGTQEEFDRIDRVFVESIYELLKRVSEYSEQDKRMLQVYVMDDYERDNIESALFNMLENLDSEQEQDLLEKVMTILFWMQGERLVTDSESQPEDTVEVPVSVLTTEISRLYVLSEEVAYSLKKISEIFSPKYNFSEDTSSYFGILSNVVEGMNIIHIWDEDMPDVKQKRIESLAYHLRKRLFVESSIISAIQGDNNKLIHLSAWPMRYRMQKPKYPEYPEIARLDFENRYEQLLSYYQIRSVRMSGIQNAIENGSILSLEYTGEGNTYSIINHDTYVGNEWFSAWLCEDTPENRLQVMLLRDTEYTGNPKRRMSSKFSVRNTDTIFYPNSFDQIYNFKDDGVVATMDFMTKDFSGFQPVKGKRYLLFEVYSDLNSDKTSIGIGKLVKRQELLDPKQISSHTELDYDKNLESICTKFWSPDDHEFSPSQKKAFIHLLEQRLTVLLGPPASGKTDFIARALITIASYYKTVEKRSLKIMITAMSHSAIENVLLKIDKMLQNSNPFGIKVYKSSRFDDKKAFEGKNVEVIWDKHVSDKMMLDEIQIIGMTSWSVYKEFHDAKTGKMRFFDIIVMDEASQIRAMDSFLNLECGDKNTRYLLVGDDDQLPPIINGKYKEIEGEKYIHGSIFRMYITGLGKDHQDIVSLSDNFRMNGILCKYSSKALYGPDYKPFNDEIKYQRLYLKNSFDDVLIDSLLDENYPLVFCELFGPAREQNDAEVKLVTDLVNQLWNSQVNSKSGKLAKDEGNFWRDKTLDNGEFLDGACGIITPHHEHINRLKTSISNNLNLNRGDIFIGTVDKLQGKERQAVIVSYGVSETEKIMNESEFIFSSNRFNVSITRGKAKTIIFLSEAIAEPNLSTNLITANDKTLEKGIKFIHGFSAYMKECEEDENIVSEEYPDYYGNVSLKVWKKRLGSDNVSESVEDDSGFYNKSNLDKNNPVLF